jgi:hypothetical protein
MKKFAAITCFSAKIVLIFMGSELKGRLTNKKGTVV